MISSFVFRRAVRALRAGGVIAHPTEAVYGLACDPLEREAVERILAIKGRSVAKGLILVAADFEQLRPFVAVPDEEALARALASWPGPVTWLFPVRPETPLWLTGRHPPLAVRVTNPPLPAALCRAAGTPLVSTSANPAGRPAPRRALAVRRYFGDTLDAILSAPVGGRARPSEIRDLATGAVLRRG